MRIVVALQSLAATPTATEAAEAVAEGWRRTAPGDELDLVPLSDGCPGFLDPTPASAAPCGPSKRPHRPAR